MKEWRECVFAGEPFEITGTPIEPDGAGLLRHCDLLERISAGFVSHEVPPTTCAACPIPAPTEAVEAMKPILGVLGMAAEAAEALPDYYRGLDQRIEHLARRLMLLETALLQAGIVHWRSEGFRPGSREREVQEDGAPDR